jgi:siroheme synthase-like protein
MRSETLTRPILPACLLVDGKPCLVVGGGPIAARKVGHLLEAEARVTVVAPEACDPLQVLSRSGRIRLIARPFEAGDVAGQCLVFAVTDNVDVNRQVLETCRKQGILCSAADSNWPQGDFIMPAITRQGGYVATVATGGRSCRQARIVKERIAKLLATMDDECSGDDKHDDRHDTP